MMTAEQMEQLDRLRARRKVLALRQARLTVLRRQVAQAMAENAEEQCRLMGIGEEQGQTAAEGGKE